eukprot:15553-Heterococcus_DN1.PRE.2
MHGVFKCINCTSKLAVAACVAAAAAAAGLCTCCHDSMMISNTGIMCTCSAIQYKAPRARFLKSYSKQLRGGLEKFPESLQLPTFSALLAKRRLVNEVHQPSGAHPLKSCSSAFTSLFCARAALCAASAARTARCSSAT